MTVPFAISAYGGGAIAPPSLHWGRIAPMGGFAGTQTMPTEPAKPSTEVRVHGMDPVPLLGRVALLAEMVKPGVAASARLQANPLPIARIDPKEQQGLFAFA